MRPCPVELVVADDGSDDAGLSALDVLVPRFEVAADASQLVRRTWLDTFDWRLHRAGVVLEHSRTAARGRLALTSVAGEVASSEVDGDVSWPSVVERLPASPLRDRLAHAAGIRALLPIAEARRRMRQVRVLNDDAKTVARLTLDRPVKRRSAQQPLSTHLTVTPVRGYAREVQQIVDLLRNVSGVAVSTTSVHDQALVAAGQQPGSYSSKVNVSLSPTMPASVAVSTVLHSFLITLEANVPGVVADVDTEFLHDLRVAVRRTRSILKLTGDFLPGSMAERFSPKFKWLGDMTTPTRDLDVFLLDFDAKAGALQAAEPADLDPFRAHLARRRDAERRRLARVLQSAKFEALLADWRSALDAALAEGGASGGPTAKELAEQRVARAYRRVVRHGSAIILDSPAEQLHELRKRCKELRYLLEIFSSVQDPAAHRRVVRQLKELQECLGDFQDSQVQRQAVSEFAAEMSSEATVPPSTILAMGELAAQVEVHQRWARADYAGRFERFMRHKNQRAFARLTGASAA